MTTFDSEQRMQKSMCDEEEYRRAAACAAAMLGRRPLSAAMLEQKLRDKQFDPDAAEYAVERMRVIGAIDDDAFAELILRSYTRKGCGMMRIRQELRRRGVPDDIASDALDGFEPDWDAMQKLLDKRLHGDVSDRRECEKAMAALQRRGFSYSQIREAMRAYCAEAVDS